MSLVQNANSSKLSDVQSRREHHWQFWVISNTCVYFWHNLSKCKLHLIHYANTLYKAICAKSYQSTQIITDYRRPLGIVLLTEEQQPGGEHGNSGTMVFLRTAPAMFAMAPFISSFLKNCLQHPLQNINTLKVWESGGLKLWDRYDENKCVCLSCVSGMESDTR